jgi:hypothetical protein
VSMVHKIGSNVQTELESAVCTQQLESASYVPLAPCLVEFPPLKKSFNNGPGPFILRRGTKSLEACSNSVGPSGAAVSDYFLITNKVDLVIKGVQAINKHIRFKNDSDCSDLSDSIEDFVEEEEKMLNLKKNLRLKKQTRGRKGRKGVLAKSAPTPPSGIDLIIQDHDEVVPETQDAMIKDVNVDALAAAKIEEIKKQVGFTFSPSKVSLVAKVSSKVDP